jgi:hypothetical protein
MADSPATLPLRSPSNPAAGPEVVPLLEAIHHQLQTLTAAVQAGRLTSSPGPEPFRMLIGWQEILEDGLKRDNDEPTRHFVARMSRVFDGPIVRGGQGSKPWAYRHELTAWWNDLRDRHEARERERRQRDMDVQAETQDRHAYGRSATLLPGIAGSVRKSRRKAG